MSRGPKIVAFNDFQQAMIEYAKSLQGDRYAGDEYYLQDSWLEEFNEGSTPEQAVEYDMQGWD